MKLKNCCNFIDYRGKTPEKAESGYRFITAKNIRIDGFHYEPMEFIPKENYESIMVRGIPSEGDILFTTEAPMGHVGVIPHFDEPFAVGQRIIVIQPNNELLNSSYLVYLLRSRHFQDKVSGRSSGSTVTGIRSKELFEIDITFPNLIGQHKIAEVLDHLSAVIAKRSSEFQLYDDLIKARFVEMFGNPIANSKKLAVQELRKVLILKAGDFTAASDIFDEPDEVHQYPCYGGNGIRGFVADYNQEGAYSLVGRQGALSGNVQFARGRFKNTEHALLVTPLVEMNSTWLNQLLLNLDLKRYQTGAAQPGLSVKNLQEIPILSVPLDEQNVFADFVNQVDKSKAAVQKSLEETQLLFDSLMQKYFG